MMVSALDQDNAPVVLGCGQVPAAQGNLVASAGELDILQLRPNVVGWLSRDTRSITVILWAIQEP